jgi:peptidyl-tRNA hydrolase, PTH1 family
MYLVAGLGNPGKKYEGTRHNAGFLALDELAKKHGFCKFTLSKKHSSLISEGFIDQTKVLLIKPQTFMNNSGRAVKSLMSTKQKLIVLHDDIDIPLGKVKVSKNRGSAGHKGVDSIIQALGSKNFTRIRVGIQPLKGKPSDTESFVLKPFLKAELPLLQSAIEEASASLLPLID